MALFALYLSVASFFPILSHKHASLSSKTASTLCYPNNLLQPSDQFVCIREESLQGAAGVFIASCEYMQLDYLNENHGHPYECHELSYFFHKKGKVIDVSWGARARFNPPFRVKVITALLRWCDAELGFVPSAEFTNPSNSKVWKRAADAVSVEKEGGE